MRAAGLAVLALCLLAACREPAPDLPPVGADAVGAARLACLKRGGNFAPGGASGALTCFTTPRDAGKACSTARDCSTLCLARSRSCAPISPVFGCNDILTRDGVRVTQCLE